MLFYKQKCVGDGRAVNHEVRKRVVREFGLPDVAVQVLRDAPDVETSRDEFPVNREFQTRNNKAMNKVRRGVEVGREREGKCNTKYYLENTVYGIFMC